MVCRESGHDILPFQFPADGVFGAVELDTTVGINLANPRDQAFCNRKGQMTPGVEVRIESKGGREMTKCGPEAVSKNAREACPVVGRTKSSVRFLEVMVAEETIARSAQGPKIRAGMAKHPILPNRIETFDCGVAAGFFRRNEAKMDAQQEVKTDELGETVTIPSPARRGHLVIHLGNAGQAHNSPGINQVTAKRDGSFVTELAGCCGLSGDINGVDGVETGDFLGAAKMTGPDQIGLLKVAHLMGLDIGIGRTVDRAFGPDLFCSPGAGQDFLDGRDGGKSAEASSLKLEVNRFGADACEGGATGPIGGQFIAQDQDIPDQGLRRLIGDMSRYPTPVTKSIEPEFSISSEPFGEPTTASMYALHGVAEPVGFFIDSNGFEPDLIFGSFSHDRLLLPMNFGKIVGDRSKCSRCPYGYTVHDVFTETH